MKTVLVDCMVLSDVKCGYSRIINNLIQRVVSSRNQNYKYIFVFQKAAYLNLITKTNETEFCKFIIVPTFKSKWIRGAFEQVAVPLLSFIRNVDLIFMPCTFGLLFPVARTLTFVHTNTSFVLSPNLRGRNVFQQHAHKILAKLTSITSKRLVFTTLQTLTEYISYTGVNKNKCQVIGNGVVRVEAPLANGDDLVDYGPYILSVSQIYRLKNFHTLIMAFRLLKQSDLLPTNFKLVIVGAVQELDYYRELVELIGTDVDVILLSNISDEYLDNLYRNAKLYCQLSLFEGYSLTPAEALMHRIPLLISDIPTHREVYSDFAMYADPRDLNDVFKKLSIILNDPKILDDIDLDRAEMVFSFESFFKRLENEFVLTLS